MFDLTVKEKLKKAKKERQSDRRRQRFDSFSVSISVISCLCVKTSVLVLVYRERRKKQPMSDLFNPLAPHITLRGGRLLGAFRMRHEKHTQSSSIPEAFTPPINAVAAAHPTSAPLNTQL